MINLDSITNENTKKHNEKWPYIPDHWYRIIIIRSSGSGKTNALTNLINEQNHNDKTYLYARDFSEPKYEYLILKSEDVGIKHLNNPNAFIKCSNTMDDVYENINNYNSIRKRKKTNCFWWHDCRYYDKRFQAIIKELFIRCRRLNISLVFSTQSYFSVPKRCKIKYNTLFYHENKQQQRITKYCN